MHACMRHACHVPCACAGTCNAAAQALCLPHKQPSHAAQHLCRPCDVSLFLVATVCPSLAAVEQQHLLHQATTWRAQRSQPSCCRRISSTSSAAPVPALTLTLLTAVLLLPVQVEAEEVDDVTEKFGVTTVPYFVLLQVTWPFFSTWHAAAAAAGLHFNSWQLAACSSAL